jgi:hypothetical protein
MYLRGLCLTILILLCVSPGWSQGSLRGLTGAVSDPLGAAAPGAELRITNLETAAEVTVRSSSEVSYLAAGLAPGWYRTAASRPGSFHRPVARKQCGGSQLVNHRRNNSNNRQRYRASFRALGYPARLLRFNPCVTRQRGGLQWCGGPH